MRRAAGVLLHPTSLPGPFGIGDLGPQAESFLVWLANAGQTYWQVLPLSPVAGSGSPYQSHSAFAGNPLLVSPEILVGQGLVADRQLAADRFAVPARSKRVDYPAAATFKERLLRAAWERPPASWPADIKLRFEAFNDDPEVRAWLDDWTLFAALKAKFDNTAWFSWPEPIRQRAVPAVAEARRELAPEIAYLTFCQFIFFDQWAMLRAAAGSLGVSFIGDLAIYVAPDSADAWSNQQIFNLEADGRPRTQAGVPPDYFSETGQLWGNPLYRWDRLADQDYDWWIRRLAWHLRSTDVLRLDHFRGFAAYWEVGADEKTAINGRWRPGPGLSFFDRAASELGNLPLIAEDLGVITDDVRQLRKEAGLPGMRVLQFGLAGPANEHTPHRVTPDTVVYSGTHDNDTAVGWFEGLDAKSRSRVLDYLGGAPEDIAWSLVRTAYTTAADTAIAPLQDVLGLGREARLNQPGKALGQWTWRLDELPGEEAAERLHRLTTVTERTATSANR